MTTTQNLPEPRRLPQPHLHILLWAMRTGPGRPLGGILKSVLCVLAMYANEEGWAFPGIERIAAEAGVGPRTAHRALLALKYAAIIEIHKTSVDGKSHNRYRLTGHAQAWQPGFVDYELAPYGTGDALELADERINELEQKVVQLQVSQIGRVTEEEEELVSQFDSQLPSSSSGGSPADQAALPANLSGQIQAQQPELQVETIESLEEPWITEMKEWVRENWNRLRYSPTNPDGFRANLPRVIVILTERGEENYRDSRTHWEAVWAEQGEALSLQEAPLPPTEAPENALPEIRVSSVDHEAQSAWREVLGDLEAKVPPQYFEAYLRRSAGYAWDLSEGDRCLLVAVRGTFAAAWLERRIFGDITRVLEIIAGEGTTVRFEVGELVIGEVEDEGNGGE